MRKLITFNEDWLFTTSPINPEAPELKNMESVNLPHTWNAEDGADGDDYYYRGVCWYAKKFPKPEGECIFLEVEAASQIAEVYLNGVYLGRHQGGFSMFRIDLTDHLTDENLLLISVDNRENEITYPQFADFTFFGGLYRGVNLLVVPETHLQMEHGDPGLHVKVEVEEDGSAIIDLNTGLTDVQVDFHFAITDADGNVVSQIVTTTGNHVFHMEHPHLWNGVKDPYLYTAHVKLNESGDEVSVRFGIRSFCIDSEKGFILNGLPYPLRGVSRHQDRQGKGWAISTEDHQFDLELIREMGANTIRLAHYQHAKKFYELCDEAGIVVWAEIPFISCFMDNQEAHDDTIMQMKEMITQCDNHPSICFWGISNEITMKGESESLVQNLKDLQTLCKKMDPTRLTTMAQIGAVPITSSTNEISDLLAYNIYLGWYVGRTKECAAWLDERRAAQPNRPIAISEYGADSNIKIHSDMPCRKDYTEEYQCLYHEEMLRVIESHPWLWATYVWNMFEFAADKRKEGGTEGLNTKGLVTYDRSVKKDAFYLYKSYWSEKSFVHICGRRFVDRVGDTTEVKVYSNQKVVTLYCDGERVETKSGEHIFIFNIPITGSHVLRAESDGFVDEIEIRKVDEPNQEYILEAGANDGVDWYLDEYGKKVQLTEIEGYFSVFDHIGDVLKNPTGAQVMQDILTQIAQVFAAQAGQESPTEMDENTLAMIQGVSISDLLGMAAPQMAQQILPSLNQALNQIKK